MEQYNITGMSCAACSARVEKAVSSVRGVTSCSVNLLTNSMGVEGTASEKEIIEAVSNAGYGASKKSEEFKSSDGDLLEDKESSVLKKRLFSSLGFLIILMYISMGYTMWSFPLPQILEAKPVAIGFFQLILSAIIILINKKFFINGFKGLIHLAPNMDTLVALGSGASFIWSVYKLIEMCGAENPHHYLHSFYFESAAMILTLITVGKMLEARSKGKTTNAIKALIKLAPKTATVIRDGKEIQLSVSQVEKGDIFIVKAGESIPVDGIVTNGSGAVDESALTGESIPIDKETGDSVSAATINQSGWLECKATRVGEDTTLSQIIKTVSNTAATKAPVAKAADKVSGVFVPVVIAISVITIIGWLISGEDFGTALSRGISVLVISCPCALGLATPVAVMVGNGVGAKNGILFKTASSLENAGKVSIVALDKTGTITNGTPVVTNIIPFDISENELLKTAFSLEKKSEHPLAKAITQKAIESGISAEEVEFFKTMPGNGVTAKLGGITVSGGNLKFIESRIEISEEEKSTVFSLSEEGKTPLLFATDKKLIGIIAVADTIKPESPEAIKQLRNMGIKVIMLTGDNEKTANAIGKTAGVDEVIAGVLPNGKEAVIRRLMKKGRVAMVGDGINDAPALTRADIGIAIGAGTDIAIDAADIVLMKSRLTDVPAAIRLSRQTLRNIHQNLFWAFMYNTLGIPLAAGLFIPVFGWELSPMFGAAAMSLSSFCVVSNALRLNLFKIHSTKKDRKIKVKIKEKKDMKKTLKIEGMMCGHCESRVKKTLEAIDGVDFADVNHETDSAVVTLTTDVSNETLINTVEEQGYTVTEIR